MERIWKSEYMYMYNWIALLNEDNIVSQLYSNVK